MSRRHASGTLDRMSIIMAFRAADGDVDGILTQDQALAALVRMKLVDTTDEALALLENAGYSQAAWSQKGVTLDLFFEAVRRVRLYNAFLDADQDTDGSVDGLELAQYMHDAGGWSHSAEAARNLLHSVASHAGSLKWSDLQDLLLNHTDSPRDLQQVEADPADISRAWLALRYDTMDSGTDFPAPPPVYGDLPGSLAMFAFAGAVAGMVSRTATAPLERLKIISQTSESKQSLKQLASSVIRNEGWRGFFAGNLANVVRVFPFTGTVCLVYSESCELLDANSRPGMEGLMARAAAGTLAGVTATLVTYPLDVVKTHLSQPGLSSGSMVGCFRSILATRGMRGLYSGLSPTLIGVAPFIAIQLASYDAFQLMLHPYFAPTVPLFIGVGAMAGLVAQSVVHPIDVIRRRMQVDTGPHITTWRVAADVVQQHGVRGLFRGWSASALKVAPAVAITLTVRDAILGRLNNSKSSDEK